MVNFSKRSYQKELLDRDDIPFADIEQNMKELNTINSLLGGHAITVKGLQKILNKQKLVLSPIHICEIGCGGGDNLLALHHYCKKNNIVIHCTGIDIKHSCIEFAKKRCTELSATWITNDYQQVNFEGIKPHIIFSSLFCHHFVEDDLLKMLRWMHEQSSKGFFINDLERNWLAYYSIKFITALFSKSYLVKNDAPLSVARGFKKEEWQQLFATAGMPNCSISWQWAFRHLIVCNHE